METWTYQMLGYVQYLMMRYRGSLEWLRRLERIEAYLIRRLARYDVEEATG